MLGGKVDASFSTNSRSMDMAYSLAHFSMKYDEEHCLAIHVSVLLHSVSRLRCHAARQSSSSSSAQLSSPPFRGSWISLLARLCVRPRGAAAKTAVCGGALVNWDMFGHTNRSGSVVASVPCMSFPIDISWGAGPDVRQTTWLLAMIP